MELGLEKLAGQFTRVQTPAEWDHLEGQAIHPSVPRTWLLPTWQVCGLTRLFHHGILGKSFPALDLELLMLMVGLKVT